MYKKTLYPKRLTAKQIEKEVTRHSKYIDYCKVWFEDGSSKIFYNTVPIERLTIDRFYYLDFINSELSKTGAFGKMGIIRSKRVVTRR